MVELSVQATLSDIGTAVFEFCGYEQLGLFIVVVSKCWAKRVAVILHARGLYSAAPLHFI
jgi:hypothetical protein